MALFQFFQGFPHIGSTSLGETCHPDIGNAVLKHAGQPHIRYVYFFSYHCNGNRITPHKPLHQKIHTGPGCSLHPCAAFIRCQIKH